MLRTSIEFLSEELNLYIKRKDPVNFADKDTVIISALMTPDGQLAFQAKSDNTVNHKIILTLINIEEDRLALDAQSYFYKTENNQFQITNPPISLNFFILVSVYSDDYKTALRLLSYVVAYFQSNNVFDNESFPNLNSNADADKPWQQIEKIILNLQTITFEQQNNLWAALGAKYMPSAIYKVRTVTFQDLEPKVEAPLIRDISIYDN